MMRLTIYKEGTQYKPINKLTELKKITNTQNPTGFEVNIMDGLK